MVKEINVPQLLAILNSIKKKGIVPNKICFFLGAGVDLSSGGKTFRQLKIDFLNKFVEPIANNISEEVLTDKFNESIERLSASEKSQFLNEIYANGIDFTDGFKMFILLAAKGYIDAVVTTNFFDFLERCEEEMQLFPFDIIAPGFVKADTYYNHVNLRKPIYLKLHGNAWTHSITHITTDEINQKGYDESIISILKHIIAEYHLVFIGYNGGDNKLTDVMSTLIKPNVISYWITPSGANYESNLVKLIDKRGELRYCTETFDEFILRYACECFSQDSLSDVHPTFILQLIEDKIRQHKKNYLEGCQELIERDLYSKIISKLFDQGMDVLLTGNKGFGKTSILKYLIKMNPHDLIIPIDMSRLKEVSILKKISAVLGYNAQIPFSLLYSFCQWCDKNCITVVFAIDSLSNSKNESNIRYRDELFNFIRVTKAFSYIRFLVVGDALFDIKIIENSLFDEENRFEVPTFSEMELECFLMERRGDISTIPSTYRDMIAIPYMCELYLKCQIDSRYESQTLPANFLNAIDTLLCNSIMIPKNLTITTVQNTLLKVSENEILEKKLKIIDLNSVCIDYLKSLNIIVIQDEVPYFSFDIMKFFYVSKLIYSKYKTRYMDKLYNYLKGKEKYSEVIYMAHLYHFIIAKNIQENSTNLYSLNDIILKYSQYNRAIKFVKRVLLLMLEENEELFVETIHQCSLNEYNIIMQKCIFAIIGNIKKDVLVYKILSDFNKIDIFLLDVFVIRSDYFNSKMKHISTIKDFEVQYDLFISSNKSLLSQYFSCYYQLMLIDTYFEGHELVIRQIISKIKELRTVLSSSFKTENLIGNVISIFQKYSFNILFNSSNRIEEDFIAISYDAKLINIYQSIICGNVLSYSDYIVLLEEAVDINNMWKFMFSNLLVVLSIKNSYLDTFNMLQNILNTFNKDTVVQQLDFYLSSLFMALYEMPGHGRNEFVLIFETLVSKFQMKLFEQPSQARIASSEKFSDEFRLIFEDGFNPLAFYFYTAPTERGIDSLPIYYELAEILTETGNESKILKIVHALGQMISIMPEAGFKELEKIIHITNHTIVKRGVIRILQEHSIRYPSETTLFIERNNDYFTENDREEIFLSLNSELETRTFEQLHWSRLFHHIGLNDSKIITKLVSAMATAKNLSTFINEIFF